jgi:hypothetical protein
MGLTDNVGKDIEMTINRCFNTLVIVLVIFSSKLAYGINCNPLEPKGGVDKVVTNTFEGNAQVLYRMLGSGDVSNAYARYQNDVLMEYPSADRLHIFDSTIYLLCTMLKNSSEPEEKKFERFERLATLYADGPPPDSSEGNLETRPEGILQSGSKFSLADGETTFLIDVNHTLTYRRTANPRCVFSVLDGKSLQHCVGSIRAIEETTNCEIIYMGTNDNGITADYVLRCKEA